MFAASIVVFAWQGIDPTFISNLNGVTDADSAKILQFGLPTAWVATGGAIAVVVGIFVSYTFFLNVSSSKISAFFLIDRADAGCV